MDSKVKFFAIVAAVSVVLFAFALVWYTNKPATPSDGHPANVQEAVEEDDGYRDFLKDENFFDPDPVTGSDQSQTESVPRLYLQGYSVMQDIRLTVTDSRGNPVTGQSFYVSIDGIGEYKDLDQDGMIYVPEIKAGDYFVTLQPVDGYIIPDEPMRVAVKDQIEYEVIDDIRSLMHDESEIDASVEDTEEQNEIEDVDDTEVRTRWEGSDAVFGIDVSKWQKDIAWEKVAASGVEFAIIRCGYRGSSSGSLVVDPYFEKNLAGAKAAGIDVGLYFFSQAVNEVEAVEEASMAVSLLQGQKIEFPIFIDVESSGGRADSLDNATRTAVCRAFCQTVDNAGYHGGVYTCRSWYYNKLNDSELNDITHWLAEYRKTPLYTGDFALWQYTSSGTIDGINTRVDLDLVWNR